MDVARPINDAIGTVTNRYTCRELSPKSHSKGAAHVKRDPIELSAQRCNLARRRDRGRKRKGEGRVGTPRRKAVLQHLGQTYWWEARGI